MTLLGILVAGRPGPSDVPHTLAIMREAGCTEILVVEEDTLSASVRAGLTWALSQDADLALLHLANKPEITTAALLRVLAAAGTGPTALARAALADHATHPVVLGRTHWQPAHDAAQGTRSAGPYLKRVPCPLIPCDDLLA